MAESSDPLLLTKSAQKVVQGADANPQGTMLITKTKLQWIPDDAATAKPVTLQLSSITKKQKAPGKPQIRLVGGLEPLLLHFQTDEDRNEVIEFLKQLRSPATTGPSSNNQKSKSSPGAIIPSPEQRQQLFANDKDLQALYGQLVASSVISEEDFWKTRRGLLDGAAVSKRQRAGLSSVMHEVERSHDGQTERVNVSLSTQDIQRIFTERPEVHRAFLAHVPHSLTEKEFWEKYFRIEYKKAARRKRYAASGKLDIENDDLDEGDELFAPFKRQLDEQQRQRAMAQLPLIDPTVNLAAEFGDRFSLGFGSLHDPGKDINDTNNAAAMLEGSFGGKGAGGGGGMGGGSRPMSGGRSALAQEVNRHAAHVLEGLPEVLAAAAGVDDKMGGKSIGATEIAARVAVAIQASQAQQQRGPGTSTSTAVSAATLEQWKERAVGKMEDLEKVIKAPVEALEIQDPRLYFANNKNAQNLLSNKEQQQQLQHTPLDDNNNKRNLGSSASVVDSLKSINSGALPTAPCTPSSAGEVLQELARDHDIEVVGRYGGGTGAAAAALGQSPAQVLSDVMLEFFRMEALKTNEMMRHMWGCVPYNTPTKQKKGEKLATHLEKQRKDLIAHTRTNPGSAQQVYISHLVQPLIQGIDAALDKYDKEIRKIGNQAAG